MLFIKWYVGALIPSLTGLRPPMARLYFSKKISIPMLYMNTTINGDYSINEKAPFDGLYYESGLYHEEYDKDTTPYACTFTLPPEVEIPIILGSVDVMRQYLMIIKLLEKWENAVDKVLPKSTPILRGLYFCEHTKAKQIHVHGLVFIRNNYYTGLSQIMALQWSRIAKASMKSMSKQGKRGGLTDKAFDRCNNIKSWMTYIQKEQSKKIDYITDITSIDDILKQHEDINDILMKHELEI